MKNYKIQEFRNTTKILDVYMNNKSQYNFIHYACENFRDDIETKGYRIPVIGVLDAGTLSIKLFCFSNIATIKGINLMNALSEELDEIERSMLEDFFTYARNNKNKIWIHWKMNGNEYGFSSIERRYNELSGEDISIDDLIPENNKIHLSQLFKQRYGVNYANVRNINIGKMYYLLNANGLNDDKILNGRKEAVSLINKKYKDVENSVSEKLIAFYYLVDKAANDQLTTECKKIKDIYGYGVTPFCYFIQDHPFVTIIVAIITGIVANKISNLF